MTKTQYELKVVNHIPEEKPDKEGFTVMRIFSKEDGQYKLKLWNNTKDHWVIQKRTGKNSGRFSWVPIQNKEANHLIKGGRLIVDTDVLTI